MWHGEGTAENGQPDSDGYDLGHEPGTRVKPPRPARPVFVGATRSTTTDIEVNTATTIAVAEAAGRSAREAFR